MAHAYLNAARPARIERAACGKKLFESRRMAFHALRNTPTKEVGAQTGHGPLKVYHCGLCGGYHVGHVPWRRQQG